MPNTYAIFKVKPKLGRDGVVTDISNRDNFIICARKVNENFIWMNNFHFLNEFIYPDTLVYCIDNLPGKIKNINDLKLEINGK